MAEEKLPKEEELEDDEVDTENEGDDGKGDSSKDKKGTKTGGSDDGKGEKTFTQAQVIKMMTKEKNQGKSSVYKELGLDPKDTKLVNMFKAFIESQKTDEQKASEEENEVKSKIEEANQRAFLAEAKAEAMLLGVKTQFVDDIVDLAVAKMNKVEDGDMKTIIGEFKTKYPDWFAKAGEEDEGKDKKGKTGQKGTGSSVKGSEKEDKGAEKGIGARLAAQRKTPANKKSYWGNH